MSYLAFKCSCGIEGFLLYTIRVRSNDNLVGSQSSCITCEAGLFGIPALLLFCQKCQRFWVGTLLEGCADMLELCYYLHTGACSDKRMLPLADLPLSSANVELVLLLDCIFILLSPFTFLCPLVYMFHVVFSVLLYVCVY